MLYGCAVEVTILITVIVVENLIFKFKIQTFNNAGVMGFLIMCVPKCLNVHMPSGSDESVLGNNCPVC